MLEEITIDDLTPYINGELGEAEPCGVPQLDRHLRFKTNLTIIGGCANTGKTVGWLWCMFTWSQELGKKWLCFCNENDNRELLVMLIEWKGRNYINRLSQDDIGKAYNWVKRHFAFMPCDYKADFGTVLDRAWNLRNTFDYDGFFLDPYNSVTSQTNYYGHYENANRMRGFVQHTGKKLCVSMHVMSEAQRTRDKDGNIKCPHISQLEMGSMWFNRSDDALTIHRQTQNKERKYITEIHVQKIKHTRSGGECTAHDEPIELHWRSAFGGFDWVDNDAGF